MTDIIFVDQYDETAERWRYYRAERASPAYGGRYIITDETDQHGVILPTRHL